MDVIDILMAKMLSGGGDPEAIASAVTDWLEDNVDPVGSAVVVDSSLSIEGAAADAKATGDAIAAKTTELVATLDENGVLMVEGMTLVSDYDTEVF